MCRGCVCLCVFVRVLLRLGDESRSTCTKMYNCNDFEWFNDCERTPYLINLFLRHSKLFDN